MIEGIRRSSSRKSRSLITSSCEGAVVLTVAVRGPSVTSAISPRKSPDLSVRDLASLAPNVGCAFHDHDQVAVVLPLGREGRGRQGALSRRLPRQLLAVLASSIAGRAARGEVARSSRLCGAPADSLRSDRHSQVDSRIRLRRASRLTACGDAGDSVRAARQHGLRVERPRQCRAAGRARCRTRTFSTASAVNA